MKRRVIQIADSTQLVSLPRKWAVAHGIKKGDELDINEQGNKIIVSTQKDYESEKAELNPPHLPNVTERYVTSLYRSGCKEIKINYNVRDNPELIDFVNKKMDDQTIGFEIVKQENDNVVIKDLSGVSEAGFETALKRTFVLVTTMVRDSLSALKNNDNGTLKNMYVVDRSVNKFTNFCARELISKGQKDMKTTAFYYHFLRDLESLSDQFSLLSVYCSSLSKPVAKQVITVYAQIQKVFDEYYDTFYRYNKEKVGNLYKNINGIDPSLLLKVKDIDNLIVNYLMMIKNRMKELLDCLIDINSQAKMI